MYIMEKQQIIQYTIEYIELNAVSAVWDTSSIPGNVVRSVGLSVGSDEFQGV